MVHTFVRYRDETIGTSSERVPIHVAALLGSYFVDVVSGVAVAYVRLDTRWPVG